MSGILREDPNEARRIGRIRPLRWSTAIAWTSWTLSLGLLWYQHRARVLHFQSLLFLILVSLTFAPALFGLVYGLWSALCGPPRRLALAWGAGSLLPTLFWVLLGLYAIHQVGKSEIPNNISWKLVSLSSGSVMEAQAVYLYPNLIETAHLVMFYDDRVGRPRRDVEAMEEHVGRLEAMTGRLLRAKIYWVRGRLLGRGQMASFGLAAGSTRSPENWETADSPLRVSVDRHELAHAVLLQHYWPDSNPPFLLVEGWAESQSGRSRVSLAAEALASRQRWLSRLGLTEDARKSYLKELLGPSWYHHIGAPIYDVGGAFVDFLLHHYGVERFLKVYFMSPSENGEAVFQRVLGEDFEAVEKKFWEEARALAGRT
jgi:hypothetical protein